MSGGSVANSIAGIAALGGTCGYIGKVADDEFGERFRHDLATLGVELDLAVAGPGEGATGRCHVFITPDAQRTMATYLGASNQLNVDDIHGDLIARSEITYVEGYLFDLPPAKESIRKVVNFAHELRLHGRALALGHVLRESTSPRLPRSRDRPTSTCCSPTRPRSSRCSSTTSSSRPSRRSTRLACSRSSRADRAGADVATVVGCRARAGDRGRARGRSKRRGRHVRLGLPLRARPRR